LIKQIRSQLEKRVKQQISESELILGVQKAIIEHEIAAMKELDNLLEEMHRNSLGVTTPIINEEEIL
jgi:hypothetical protein